MTNTARAQIGPRWNSAGFWEFPCGCAQYQDGLERCPAHRGMLIRPWPSKSVERRVMTLRPPTKPKGAETMLSELKNFNVDRMDVDEMIALSALGKTVRAEFQNRGAQTPEWLTEKLATLDREILNKRRDLIELRLKEVRAQAALLETREDKRARLAREEAELQAQLTGQSA